MTEKQLGSAEEQKVVQVITDILSPYAQAAYNQISPTDVAQSWRDTLEELTENELEQVEQALLYLSTAPKQVRQAKAMRRVLDKMAGKG
mgnify:FL=1